MMTTATGGGGQGNKNREKSEPRYKEIGDELRMQITCGSYRLAEKLPSEHELMQRYETSRATVRKALAGLAQMGLVYSRRGEGYFVSRPSLTQDLQRLQGLSECAEASGHEVCSEVLSTQEVPADPTVAASLRLAADTPVFELKRLRYVNRAPFSFVVSYFPLVLGQELVKSDLSRVDVYSLLGELLDDDLSHADYIIEITAAEQKVALALDVPVGGSLIRMTRVAFMMSGKPVDFEYVYGRPDSYRFKVRVPRW